jgi:CheY-like chemotaxis protein
LHLSHTWEQQRQLVGNVSHELRTPLTIIQGYIDSLLRRGDNLTTAQREALTITASEAKRTIQLLQDLIDLARAESGRIHLQIEPFILNDLVSEVVEMSQQVSQREIKVQLPLKLVEVETDRDRAKQVLINLIDNALKYSPDTEPVTVAVIPEPEQVLIEVRDQGGGIALRHQARIFERFYRVDEARTRSGGTGLGLAIVKTLVEQMGGQITLRSQPHQGSTFIVTLPRVYWLLITVYRYKMTAHILIIEDEANLARFIELELTCEGYQVSIAHNGLTGLTQARESSPDLILLDWMLPGIEGVEVCQRLRDKYLDKINCIFWAEVLNDMFYGFNQVRITLIILGL